MFNLPNILMFIEMSGEIKSKREFELAAGLSNSTIWGSENAKKELSFENVSKIIDRYGDQLEEKGFKIIDLTPIGIEYKLIATEDQVLHLKNFFGSVSLKPQDLSPEQVPVLLYAEMRELVKGIQEIAKNTRKEPPSELDNVQDEIDKDKPPGKGRRNKL